MPKAGSVRADFDEGRIFEAGLVGPPADIDFAVDVNDAVMAWWPYEDDFHNNWNPESFLDTTEPTDNIMPYAPSFLEPLSGQVGGLFQFWMDGDELRSSFMPSSCCGSC